MNTITHSIQAITLFICGAIALIFAMDTSQLNVEAYQCTALLAATIAVFSTMLRYRSQPVDFNNSRILTWIKK